MDLPEAMEIEIKAMDVFGREIEEIAVNHFFQKGNQSLKVDAAKWGNGIYAIHFRSGQMSFAKLLIIK